MQVVGLLNLSLCYTIYGCALEPSPQIIVQYSKKYTEAIETVEYDRARLKVLDGGMKSLLLCGH